MATESGEKMRFDDQALVSKLIELGISTTTREHEPLRTVEDGQLLHNDMPGGHAKNLFLRDKRKKYWLIVALTDTPIDLKATAHLLEAQRLSFANPAELEEVLGIKPGAVSPFAVINDQANLVSVVLDKRLLDFSPLNFHPLRNDRTTAIATQDFLNFLQAAKHPPRIVDIPGAE